MSSARRPAADSPRSRSLSSACTTGCWAIRRPMTGHGPSILSNCAPSSPRRSRPCWRRSISTTTARRARNSWPGCKARSASAASSMCCATASSTASTMSTCSMARRHRAMPRPPSAFALNRFSVTRQLRYSRDDTAHALDLALFINGLPVATFELKNSLTKQTVEDAVEQYKRDRDPREKLFEFGRCMVHFAVDDAQVDVLHPAEGQGVVVPAVQQGMQRRRGQSAEPRRTEDGLSLEGYPHAARPDGHHRELCSDRRTATTRRPAR